MPKYKVNLSASLELDTIDEAEARYHAIRLLEKDVWGNIKVDSVQNLAPNRGLRAEMNVFDDLILPEFDENNLDIECVWQTWKKIVKDYIKGEN